MNSPLPDPALVGSAISSAASSVGAAFRDVVGAFRRHGLATPELDARLLVCAACGLSHERFAANPDRYVEREDAMRIERFRERRLSGEPVSRILGFREFRGLQFAIGPETLDPRPDTETVVDAVVDLAGELNAGKDVLELLDLGTGSGCILVSLLQELPHATGFATDIDAGALRTARANADRLGVGGRARFLCGSWLDAVSGDFDIVVANPPYIPRNEIAGLPVEVARYDPRRALDGGTDGLQCYRRIIAGLNGAVRPGGWAVFECGSGQDTAVLEILMRHGFGSGGGDVRRWRDLAGHVRCIAARVPQ